MEYPEQMIKERKRERVYLEDLGDSIDLDLLLFKDFFWIAIFIE
jgi:hypothetical protein